MRMVRVGGRPIGVWIVTAMVVADGFGFLGAAYNFVASAPIDWFAALAAALVGMLLLWKAWALWTFHWVGWLVVLLLNIGGAAIGAVEIARGHAEPGTWASVGLAMLTVVYLSLPSVRALYPHHAHARVSAPR